MADPTGDPRSTLWEPLALRLSICLFVSSASPTYEAVFLVGTCETFSISRDIFGFLTSIQKASSKIFHPQSIGLQLLVETSLTYAVTDNAYRMLSGLNQSVPLALRIVCKGLFYTLKSKINLVCKVN